MSGHHEFGPSCLRRRELCPGSAWEEYGLPEIHSQASMRGSKLHQFIANAISCMEYKADEDDEKIVQDMFAFLRDRTSDYSQSNIFAEMQLEYWKGDEELFFGTCDVIAVDQKNHTGVIIDWKTGFNEVDPAEDNIQGLGYAVCAMQMYNLEYVTVVFYNPVIHQKSEYTFERSPSLFNHVERVISDSKNGKGNLKPGEEQCRYCKAALHGTCKAFRDMAEEVYQVAKTQPLEMLFVMPDATLAEVIDKGKLIGKFIEAAESEMKKRCELSGEVAGWTVKEVSGGRDADDIKGLFCMLKPELDQETFLSCCKVSIPSLEKLFIKALGCPVKEGKERFADLTADYVSEKPPKKMLAKVKGEK
jgi:hypothetical protein